MSKLKRVIDIFPPKGKKEVDLSLSPVKIETEEKLGELKAVNPRSKKRMAFILVLVFLIFGLAAVNFFFQKAEVEIWPETETVDFEEKISADIKNEQLDFEKKVIPGKIFEHTSELSQQFSATGKMLAEKNARGIIRIFNNYHLSQTLVATTRFQPPLEKVLYFRLTKTVVVPAKSSLDAEVKADRPGEEYNIAPSTFALPGLKGLPQYYSIYGKSLSPMTGGLRAEVSEVSESDLQKAKNVLQEKLTKEVKNYFKTVTSEDFIFADECILTEILEASSSVPAGTEAESFNYKLKVKSKAISFKKSDLDNISQEFINMRTQNTDKKIQPDSLKVNYSIDSLDREAGKAVLKLKISAKIYSDIDFNALKRNILGKSIEENEHLLKNQPQISKARLRVFPFWLKKVPESEEKVEIILNLSQ